MNTIFDLSKPIAIGADHAGFDYKEDLISFLEAKDLAFHDYGTHSKDSVDYPDFAHPVANAVENGEAAFGIFFAAALMVLLLRPISIKGFVRLYAGEKKLQSWQENIIMPISFVFLPALSVKAMLKKWCSFLYTLLLKAAATNAGSKKSLKAADMASLSSIYSFFKIYRALYLSLRIHL